MRGLRSQDGHTLVELLSAVALMAVVLAAVLGTFEQFVSVDAANRERAKDRAQARTALAPLARDLRNQATPAPGLEVAIEQATGTDLAFVSVDDAPRAGNPRSLRRVRYCVADRTLWRQVQSVTGAALATAARPSLAACPGTGWTAGQVVARDVATTTPLFRYGAAGRAWSGDTTQITSVRVALQVDSTPGRAPAASVADTTVTLRNQNRRPHAAFEATALGARRVLLVAGGSSDHEGESLRYTWKVDGADLPAPGCVATSSTCEVTLPEGARTVVLTVTDPAGLSTTSEPSTVEVRP
jgi:type II secretory pathway component PulJ